MSTFNPFSCHDKQHFPEFSPMFRKKTPTNTEKNGFKWSIDHISRLKPAHIDTDEDTLDITNKHSPDYDADRQKAIDVYFSQKTILPSPWPYAPSTKVTLGNVRLPKQVTFSPLPPATAFIQEQSLVESQMRDNNTADVGTQTTLTLPMTFDLEKLITSAVCHTHNATLEGEDEGRDVGNASLRRKLFGQPGKQGSCCSGNIDEVMTFSNLTSISPSENPESDHTQLNSSPAAEVHSPCQASSSPNIVLTCSTPYHTTHSGLDATDNGVFQSSMVLHTPGEHLPMLSPIGDEEEECVALKTALTSDLISPSDNSAGAASIPNASPFSLDAKPKCFMMEEEKLVSPAKTKCTSTPNMAVMKRQLAPSPFASPVLKHQCTTHEDELLSHDISPQGLDDKKRETLCDHSDDETDDDLARPLCLADLCTQTYDLTGVTSTACTGYFNMMCLDEDLERDTMGTNSNRLHPLHSTAAHLGSTCFSNLQQTPVHSTMTNSQNRDQPQQQIGSISQIHIPTFGTGNSQISGGDSGVCGSTEIYSNERLSTSRNQTGTGLKCPMATSLVPQSATNCTPTLRGGDSSVSAPVHSWRHVDHLKHSMLSTIHEGVPSPLNQQTSSESITSPHLEKEEMQESVVDSGLVFASNDNQSVWTPNNGHHDVGTPTNTANNGVLATVMKDSTHYYTPSRISSVPQSTVTTTISNVITTGTHGTPDNSSKLSFLPTHLKMGFLSKQMASLPSLYSHATPTLWSCATRHRHATPTSLPSSVPRSYLSSPARRVNHGSNSAHTTPHRYSSGLKRIGVLSKNEGGTNLSPIFGDELLKKKETIKSRLQFKSPMRTPLVISKPKSSMNFIERLRIPLQSSPVNHCHHPPSINKKHGSLTPNMAVMSPLPIPPWQTPHSRTSHHHHKENFNTCDYFDSNASRTKLKTFHHY